MRRGWTSASNGCGVLMARVGYICHGMESWMIVNAVLED